MSKNNNVNPGQYKVAGRERQGENVVAQSHKAQFTQTQAEPSGSRPPATNDERKKDASTEEDR